LEVTNVLLFLSKVKNHKVMSNELQKTNEYLQMMPIEQAKGWYDEFVLFSKSILKKDLDFGEIPGTNKPTLYKAGAEKLRFVYGLGVEMECIDKVLDLDRPFIKYTYRCTIVSKASQKVAQCEGSCNSLEPKFGYLWKTKEEIPESYDLSKLPAKTTGKKISEMAFAINKAETTGQYGKPLEYWAKWAKAIENGTAKKITRKTKTGREMDAYELNESVTVYRILNPDVIGVDNTLMKMAQKRSFVGAMLLATGASEFFTQDVEDMIDAPDTIYTDYTDVGKNTNGVILPSDNQSADFYETWQREISSMETKRKLNDLYEVHKDTVNNDEKLREMFKKQQATFKTAKTSAQ
jgi:hypothetical protein